MTYAECAKRLREEGYNHVDSNRWGRVAGARKLRFAFVVEDKATGACEILYRD